MEDKEEWFTEIVSRPPQDLVLSFTVVLGGDSGTAAGRCDRALGRGADQRARVVIYQEQLEELTTSRRVARVNYLKKGQ